MIIYRQFQDVGGSLLKNSKLLLLTQGAVIAAMYTVLTFVSDIFGLASGAVQLRISEALTVLPCFTPAAIPGLFIGCLLSNLLAGCALWDIVFGSLATLFAAFLTFAARRYKYFAVIPPIVLNTIAVPLILRYVYDLKNALPYLFLTVGLGELVSCGVFGTLLLAALEKNKERIFGNIFAERQDK
jgi:uncharacterized membrane protein